MAYLNAIPPQSRRHESPDQLELVNRRNTITWEQKFASTFGTLTIGRRLGREDPRACCSRHSDERHQSWPGDIRRVQGHPAAQAGCGDSGPILPRSCSRSMSPHLPFRSRIKNFPDVAVGCRNHRDRAVMTSSKGLLVGLPMCILLWEAEP
jgi:hypothetical protein